MKKINKTKRAVSAVIASALAAHTLCTGQLAVMAEEAETYSGTLGSISWEYVHDDVALYSKLIISGEGGIPSLEELELEQYPWSEWSFVHVDIEKGVTSVPAGVFGGDNLYIDLPSTMERVEAYAFTDLNVLSLTSYSLDCVYEENAFTFASEAKGGVSGYSGSTAEAFAELHGFEFVSLGDKKSGNYSDESFNYYLFEDHAMVTGFTGNETEAVIPEYIDDIPVTTIGPNAFMRSSTLRSVSLPDTVTSIGENSFKLCPALETVSATSVRTIGVSAFEGCTALKTADMGSSLESIGELAFSGCTALTDMIIPDTVSEIGENAFESTGLVSVRLPYALILLNRHVFKDCTSLESIELSESVSTIYYNAFENVPVEAIPDIPEGTEVIVESYDFMSDGEADAVVPDFVTTMSYDSYLFYDTLTIGRNVREFIPIAFEIGCITDVKQKEIYVDEENPYFYAEDGVLYNKDKTEIIHIAFGHDFTDGVFTIPASVTKIRCSLHCKKISSFAVEEGNTAFSSEKGVLMNADKTAIIQYPAGSKESNYTIPNGLKKVCKGSFYNSDIDSLIIPESVECIESGSFWGTFPIFVVFEHTKDSVLEIADDFHGFYSGDKFFGTDTTYYAYEGTVIETMFPDNFVSRNVSSSGTCGDDLTWTKEDLKLIISGSGRMTECEPGKYPWSTIPYTSVVFEGSDIEIAESAFADNNHLFEVSLSGVAIIGMNAFNGCDNLNTINDHSSITWVMNGALENTGWISKRHNDTGLNILGSVLVKYAGTSETAEIPESVTYVADRAFSENRCKILCVPETGVIYSGGAFDNNMSVEHVRFAGSESDITADDFKKAASLCSEIILADASGNEIQGMAYTSDNSLMYLGNALDETPYMINLYNEYCRSIIRMCSDEMTDQQLIDVIYNYMKTNVKYGFTYAENPYGRYTNGDSVYELSSGLSHTSVGIITMGRGVCSAYADIVNRYAAIINETGISDTLRSESSTGLNHEWNAVGLDAGTENEKWYYLDLSNGTYLIGYHSSIVTSNPEMFSYDPELAANEDGTYTVALSSGKTVNIQSADAELAAVKGDVNGDGKVTIDDATAVLTMYACAAAGMEITGSKAAADVDGNGTADITDATAILTYYAQYSAGMEPDWNELLSAG